MMAPIIAATYRLEQHLYNYYECTDALHTTMLHTTMLLAWYTFALVRGGTPVD